MWCGPCFETLQPLPVRVTDSFSEEVMLSWNQKDTWKCAKWSGGSHIFDSKRFKSINVLNIEHGILYNKSCHYAISKYIRCNGPLLSAWNPLVITWWYKVRSWPMTGILLLELLYWKMWSYLPSGETCCLAQVEVHKWLKP